MKSKAFKLKVGTVIAGLALSLLILTSSASVFAQGSLPPAVTTQGSLPPAVTTQGSSNSTFTLQNPLKVNSVSDIILTFMQVATYLAVLFAVLMIVYVGLRFVLARGDSAELTKRKDQLLWIVVGVAVIIGARILISVIINTLSATGTVNPSIIQNAQNAIKKQ
jgi:hypothetical protein